MKKWAFLLLFIMACIVVYGYITSGIEVSVMQWVLTPTFGLYFLVMAVEEFNSRSSADTSHLVTLPSVGAVIDLYSLNVYPIMENGDIDEYNPTSLGEVSDEWKESLSEEDKEKIDAIISMELWETDY